MSRHLIVASALAAALLASATLARADVDVVPYGADGWRYQTYRSAAAVPQDWAATSVDESTLADGVMPFGSWDQGGAGCPLAAEAKTLWPSPGFLVARHTFTLPLGSTDVRLYLGLDNNAIVAVNGTIVTSDGIHHENCPARDDFWVDVPRQLLNRRGPNVLAILAQDEGKESWLDVHVVANDPGALR